MTLLKIPKLEFIAQNKKDLSLTEAESFFLHPFLCFYHSNIFFFFKGMTFEKIDDYHCH